MIRKCGIVLILLMVVACRATPAVAANFIWRVDAANGGQAFIMGSIHLAYEGLYPLRTPIMEAFAQSSGLVVEIDAEGLPPGTLERFIMANGLSKDRRPLKERLSPETRSALEQSGFYSPQLDALTPWLAALVIQLEVMNLNGFKAEYGIDKYFIDLAKGRGLKVLNLETIEEQMGMMVDMSDYEADLFLRSAVLEMGDLPDTMQAFLDTWNRGDVEGFTSVFFREYDKYPELASLLDKVIYHRNKKMAEKINGIVSPKATYFIVVGAGHLVGDRSILSHLRAKGYKITQL